MKKLIFTRVEQIHLLSNIVISHLKYDLKFRKLGTKKLFLNAIKVKADIGCYKEPFDLEATHVL